MAMQKHRNATAGGIFLFLGPVAGAGYGVMVGNPIVWMLYGFAAGAVLAATVWVLDRKRR